MMRIWARRISTKWHREFRRKGFDFLNSFSLAYQAAEKKYQLRKLKKRYAGTQAEPEKEPRVTKMEDIPNIEYTRDFLKKTIAKLEKECGPFKFNISNEKNVFDKRIEINDELCKRLWLEILKDKENAFKILLALQMALEIGCSPMDLAKESGSAQPGAQPKQPSPEELKQRIQQYNEEIEKTVSSNDMCRVDIGLIISRPPIFLQQTRAYICSMSDEEIKWHQYRYKFMNKYYVDMRALHKDVEDLVPTTAEYLREVINRDPYDTDQQPTHRIKNPDGTYSVYYAASKHFTRVDPDVKDRHSLHYAGNHRVYLLLKNPKTKEWEFPTLSMRARQTVQNAKDGLFAKISGNKWTIHHFESYPLITTLRELPPDERDMLRYAGFNGVRTFYFMANHKSGVPEVDKSAYEDYAWVPKREVNKFFQRDYFEEFKYILWDTQLTIEH